VSRARRDLPRTLAHIAPVAWRERIRRS